MKHHANADIEKEAENRDLRRNWARESKIGANTQYTRLGRNWLEKTLSSIGRDVQSTV